MNSENKDQGLFHKRLSVVLQIIRDYSGSVPLHRFLKQNFSSHRNYGSKDRRLYSDLTYAYYRLGRALPELKTEQRLVIGAWLSFDEDTPLLQYFVGNFVPELISCPVSLPPEEKLEHLVALFPGFRIEDLAPAKFPLSEGISVREAGIQLLKKPLVWIRMRNEQQALTEMKKAAIAPLMTGSDGTAFAFAPSSKLTALDSYANGAFEIQDLSSQEAGKLIPASSGERWWDCCCGAGGKTLQLADRVQGVKITCSDVRTSVLDNLKERLQRNKIHNVESVIRADLTSEVLTGQIPGPFDGIIADVPCSGSGTWARTPEQCTFFDAEALLSFQKRQLAILEHVWPFLKSGGVLVYLTCSIYKVENEDVVSDFCGRFNAMLIRSVLINGTSDSADSMFVSLIKKA